MILPLVRAWLVPLRENKFPTFAQEQGGAAILGQGSGVGQCVTAWMAWLGTTRLSSVALPEPLGDECQLLQGQHCQLWLHQVLKGAGGHGADEGGGRAGHEAPSAPDLWGQGLHPLPRVPWHGVTRPHLRVLLEAQAEQPWQPWGHLEDVKGQAEHGLQREENARSQDPWGTPKSPCDPLNLHPASGC